LSDSPPPGCGIASVARQRAATSLSPLCRGGGIVFGPQPRDYRTDIPRKVRQLARQSALNARAADGSLVVVEKLVFDAPRTARLVELLSRLGVADTKVLVLTNGMNGNVFLSGRNLPNVHVMAYPEASAYDILWATAVVVEEGAITGQVPEATDDASSLDVKQPRAKREPAAEKPKKKAAKVASAKAARAEKAAKAEKKATKPKSAKKPAAKPKKKSSPKASAKKPAAKKAPKKKKGGK